MPTLCARVAVGRVAPHFAVVFNSCLTTRLGADVRNSRYKAGGRGRRQEAEAGGRRQRKEAEAGDRSRRQRQEAEAGGRGRRQIPN